MKNSKRRRKDTQYKREREKKKTDNITNRQKSNETK